MVQTSNLLLNRIQSALGTAVNPSLTTASACYDLFEAYILLLVVRAAADEGANFYFENVAGQRVDGVQAQTFVFRSSPGYIYSRSQAYTHAVIQFPNVPNCPELEAHMGVRVDGKSDVLHECDVAVILRDKAIECRDIGRSPRHTEVVFLCECKFYTSSLSLGLSRSFLGLMSELHTKRNSYFISNNSSDSIKKVLSYKQGNWLLKDEIFPMNQDRVNSLIASFRDSFEKFVNKYR